MKYDIDNLNFRPLTADEIELRVGTVSSKGATLLLYQDARCAMDILDETVGKNCWQRDHKEVKGNMYCSIGIWDENKNEWIWKSDCGVESNTEAVKGEASDSFKRSAVNWGIGRELYSSPFIFVKCPTVQRQRGGYELAEKYLFSDAKVSHIKLDDKRKIKELVIEGGDGAELFRYPRNNNYVPRASQPRQQSGYDAGEDYSPHDMITAEEAMTLKEVISDVNYDTKTLLAYVGGKLNREIASVDSMTKNEYICALKALEAYRARLEQRL